MQAFSGNDIDAEGLEYFNLAGEEAVDAEVPLLFISFPSVKDPEWENNPGRQVLVPIHRTQHNKYLGRAEKSTCAIVTLANWDWFKKWEDRQVKKRGDDYEEVKDAIGHKMIEQTCKLFPQIR